MSNLSLLMGLVSGCLLYACNAAAGTDAVPGIWQRHFVGSLFLWCAVVGVYAFRVTR